MPGASIEGVAERISAVASADTAEDASPRNAHERVASRPSAPSSLPSFPSWSPPPIRPSSLDPDLGQRLLPRFDAPDVFTHDHIPLLGVFSSTSQTSCFDFNHPGPLLFDLWALPVRLFGGNAGTVVAYAPNAARQFRERRGADRERRRWFTNHGGSGGGESACTPDTSRQCCDPRNVH
jgi:hypothetical protein